MRRAPRSFMFVPGHRARMVERALGIGEFPPGELDVAILDLEDGVPAAAKDDARALLRRTLAAAPGVTARYVRVNALARAQVARDLDAVVQSGLDGIVLPKVESADEVAAFADAVAERERAVGIGPVALVASIESARALLAAPAIAAHDRVTALLFGAEDFALDLGLPTRREAEAAELLHARSSVVVAAMGSRRLAIDGIWPDLDDDAGLQRDALLARRLGFTGKSLIHPKQIGTINRAFTPSPEELDHARRVVRAFDEARAKGLGAIAVDGELLDAPIVDRARRTLERGGGQK